jgi:ribonuclease P protein component
MERLKKRADFLKAARGRKWAAPGLVLQSVRRGGDAPPRVGFTVTKRIGNAPQRNRAKRRLREAARMVMPGRAQDGYDYVLIGRYSTLERDFGGLKDDLVLALRKVHKAEARNDRSSVQPGNGNKG